MWKSGRKSENKQDSKYGRAPIRACGACKGRRRISLPIDCMASDIEGNHDPALDVKDRPQIPLDHQGEYSLPHEGQKPVDFVRSQAAVKRVFLEDQLCRPRRFLLRGWQCVECSPKGFRCRKAILHARHGGDFVMAVSMSTSRPASASSIPRQTSSGMSGFSIWRIIRSTSLRTTRPCQEFGGRNNF